MRSIKEVLMARDGMTAAEADELIKEARAAMVGYLDEDDLEAAEMVCEEYFGLEPDYLIELL